MSWFTGLGAKLTDALSRGLDLVLARLVRVQGSLKGVELEIQKRVPDLPPPAAAALLGHVSRASEAAVAMTTNPDQPFEELERIPENPMLSERLEPGDRFVYTADVGLPGEDGAGLGTFRIDVASSIPLSANEVKSLATEEVERRKEKSPVVLPPAGQPGTGGFIPTDIAFDLYGVVRVF